MKAIHNGGVVRTNMWVAVFDMSKIKNESNSQHNTQASFYRSAVFDMSKIKNESNSQQELPAEEFNGAVFDMSKIKNESNSQLVQVFTSFHYRCI